MNNNHLGLKFLRGFSKTSVIRIKTKFITLQIIFTFIFTKVIY
jgi:hypothetical protein